MSHKSFTTCYQAFNIVTKSELFAFLKSNPHVSDALLELPLAHSKYAFIFNTQVNFAFLKTASLLALQHLSEPHKNVFNFATVKEQSPCLGCATVCTLCNCTTVQQLCNNPHVSPALLPLACPGLVTKATRCKTPKLAIILQNGTVYSGLSSLLPS